MEPELADIQPCARDQPLAGFEHGVWHRGAGPEQRLPRRARRDELLVAQNRERQRSRLDQLMRSVRVRIIEQGPSNRNEPFERVSSLIS